MIRRPSATSGDSTGAAIEQAGTTPTNPAGTSDQQDQLFKRHLGWVSLAAMTFSGMVGSGWLFAAFYAAKAAGPAALAAWVIGGAVTVLVGITFVELGVTRPFSGGAVRWPALILGPFCGVMVGWVLFMQVALAAPGEASGIMQYSSTWWPALMSGKKLSPLGLAMAVLVLIAIVGVNWFGIRLLARANNLLTIFKVIVPLLTVVMLLATGFHTGNIKAGGGWAPFGAGAMLTALTGAGLVYSFGGIQFVSAGMAGEARRPRRDIPLGTFVGFGGAFVLYLLLQTSYLGGVPQHMLAAAGWHGINFQSPFADLAVLLNLGWLSTLLIIDATISPTANVFVSTSYYARNTYGNGQNHTFPAWVAKVDAKSGVPRNALALNLAVSILFLLIFQSWQALATALSMFFAVSYAAIAMAAGMNRHDSRVTERPWFRGTRFVAPAAFAVSALIMYWASWPKVRIAILLILISIPLFLILTRTDPTHIPTTSFKTGAWFLVLILMIGLTSFMGSFGGQDWISAPWDSIIVAVCSLAIYVWGARSSKSWLRTQHLATAGNPAHATHTTTPRADPA